MSERDDDEPAFRSGNRTPTTPVEIHIAHPRTTTDERVDAAVTAATNDHRLKALEQRAGAQGRWLATALLASATGILAGFGSFYARGAADGAAHDQLQRALQDIHDLQGQVRALELGRHASLLTPDPSPSPIANNLPRTP